MSIINFLKVKDLFFRLTICDRSKAMTAVSRITLSHFYHFLELGIPSQYTYGNTCQLTDC